MTYIFDTDVLTLYLAGGSAAERINRRIRRIGSPQVVTSIITYEEQSRGWLGLLGRSGSRRELIHHYALLSRHPLYFHALTVLDFDEPAAIWFQQLRSRHRRIGTMDLRIASIALAHDAVLVTRNSSDSRGIENLLTENWAE